MQENLSNLLEKIYISSPGACDTAVSPSLWHRDPSSVKTCVTKDRRQTRAWRTTELQPRLHGNLPYEPSSAGQRTTHIQKTPPGLSGVIQDYLTHIWPISRPPFESRQSGTE